MTLRRPGNIQHTNALFIETCPMDNREAVMFTLKEQDHEGYPSLYRLYMEEMDPTEYDFAMKYIGSYDHWIRITQSFHISKHIEKWRRDLEVKIKAEALKRVLDIARNSKKAPQTALAANRFLLESGYQKTVSHQPKRGRPSKKEIANNAEVLMDQILDDYEKMTSHEIKTN